MNLKGVVFWVIVRKLFNNNINSRPPACIDQLLGLEKPLIKFVWPNRQKLPCEKYAKICTVQKFLVIWVEETLTVPLGKKLKPLVNSPDCFLCHGLTVTWYNNFGKHFFEFKFQTVFKFQITYMCS